MKKSFKQQVYCIKGTTYLTRSDYLRAYRQRDRRMHNWKVQTGLFSKGKLWKPRKQRRRIQLDRIGLWQERHDREVMAQRERKRRHWSWERI